MLALKTWPRVAPTQPSKELLDLPDELLDLVLLQLYTDGGSFIRDVLPSSLTCRRLRKAAAPILFHTLSTRITWRYVDRRSFNILLNLEYAPYTFASQIRHLKQDDGYIFRADGCEDLRLSNGLVRGLAVQGLRKLINVRSLSVGCCNGALIHLMRQAFPDKTFHITIQGCVCSRWANGSWIDLFTMCNSPIQHRFSLSLDSDMRLCDLEPFLSQAPTKLHALSWTNPARTFPLICLQFPTLQSLQELHLREPKDHPIPTLDTLLPQLPHLKRLSLHGSALIQTALKSISQLTCLESLRLHSTIDRIFHAHLRNHTFEGLPYLRLPNLRALEIRYISRYLSIPHIVPQSTKLAHLRIEYGTRHERLTPYDLRWIARAAPNLHTLEITIGPLANLWHPTAIAGVDLEVDVYGTFDALSSFSKLHTLRLFPSYWHSAGSHLHFTQPLSDEQAVRIFHHLRLSCSRLRLLIIANSSLDYRMRNDVFSRGLNGEPVKWAVRPLGDGRTLLTTHEAKRSYSLEQVWEGDRRLTMVTSRHQGVRLHSDELGRDGEEGWVLPGVELPVDERGACVGWDGGGFEGSGSGGFEGFGA